MIIKAVIERLKGSSLYQEWQKNNPDYFLSYLLFNFDADLNKLSEEIGFYHDEKNQVSVFVVSNGEITISENLEILSAGKVQRLESEEINVDYPEAMAIFSSQRNRRPEKNFVRGMAVLQKINRPIWNISFFTNDGKVLNVKIDAVKREIISSDFDYLFRDWGKAG